MGSLKTIILMTSIVFLFGILGLIIGGESGMIIAFFFALFGNFVAYWYSDKIILKYYNAKKVENKSETEIVKTVKEIAFKANISTPKIYIINEKAPNAFATGRNPDNAAIAVTSGLIEILSASELKGVIAHEIAHIVNRDILISTISATFASAISSLSYLSFFLNRGRSNSNGVNPIVLILISLLAPIGATLIQMAISRVREFEADKNGAYYTDDPKALVSALMKIESFSKTNSFDKAQKRPETAQMMIMSPLSGTGLQNLFSTHPPTEERIAKLNRLEKKKRYEKSSLD